MVRDLYDLLHYFIGCPPYPEHVFWLREGQLVLNIPFFSCMIGKVGGTHMLMAERQLKIIHLIQKKGSVQVDELAKELEVSTMTIRRDLEKLNAEGLIERCHGGAVYKQEVTYADKQVSNQPIKEKLAQICASFVKDGDAIFLDAGTTTFEIAKLIMNIPNIMVLSNDLEIIRLLANSDVELMICGGNVQKNTGSIYGYYATQMIEQLQFDLGFFGTAAVNSHLKVMTPTTDKGFLKRTVADHCQQSFLVADQSKFNKTALTLVNELTDYHYIVTDYSFSERESGILKKGNTKILSLV